jgi:hypothetical protein
MLRFGNFSVPDRFVIYYVCLSKIRIIIITHRHTWLTDTVRRNVSVPFLEEWALKKYAFMCRLLNNYINYDLYLYLFYGHKIGVIKDYITSIKRKA